MPANDNPTWKTHDGRTLLPAQMDTGHIVNALFFMKRKCMALAERAAHVNALHCISMASTFNGEGAQAACLAEADRPPEKWLVYAPSIVGAFIAELEARGLDVSPVYKDHQCLPVKLRQKRPSSTPGSTTEPAPKPSTDGVCGSREPLS